MKTESIKNACRVLIFLLLPGAIVFQNADAQHLEHLATYEPFEYAVDLCIAGSYAYIADHHGNSLEIIDISDPSNPEFAGNYGINPVWSVAVREPYAYILTSPEAIEVIDITDPVNPTFVAARPASHSPLQLHISGDYLYVAEEYGFEIFDISNPENPISLSYTDGTQVALDIYVSGIYAYVVSSDIVFMCDAFCALSIFDITDRQDPQLVSHTELYFPLSVFVSGRYAYVGREAYGLTIFDIADRSQPFIAGQYDLPGDLYGLSVVEPYVFAPYGTDSNAGTIEIIDVSDPANPQSVTSHPAYGRPLDIAVQMPNVYVANLTSLDIFRFVIPPCDNSYIAGDCNHNGVPLELSDITAMINMFRGNSPPYYFCDCQPHGFLFASTADPSGNCVAFELTDVVTEIGAYRGSTAVSSCPDCPGSERIRSPANFETDEGK